MERKCGYCMSFAVRPPEIELARAAKPMSACGPGAYCHGGPVRGWCEHHRKMAESTGVCPAFQPGGPVVKMAGAQNQSEPAYGGDGSSNVAGQALDTVDGAALAIGVIAGLALGGLVGRVQGGSAAVSASEIPRYWVEGRSAASGSIRTDGDKLYSYGLEIGYTDLDGTKVLVDYSRSGEFRSATTAKHVGWARAHADRVVHPSGRQAPPQGPSGVVRPQMVPAYWKRGLPARDARDALHTDGSDLYSYDLKIGWTDRQGRKVLGQYTGKGEYHSQTTSRHVGYARSHADLVVDPTHKRLSLRDLPRLPSSGR